MRLRRAAEHHEVMRMIKPQDHISTVEYYHGLCACGCGQMGHDVHHALIGRQKKFPELDAPENLVLVNHYEHIARKFDNQDWRRKFYQKQCNRFGVDHMQAWIDNLPAKLDRDRIDFID